MLEIKVSNQFKKDLKLMSRRVADLDLMNTVVTTPASGAQLEAKYYDHALTGCWVGYRECHIKPDWLLIYRISDNKLYLMLSRTGTYGDLF